MSQIPSGKFIGASNGIVEVCKRIKNACMDFEGTLETFGIDPDKDYSFKENREAFDEYMRRIARHHRKNLIRTRDGKPAKTLFDKLSNEYLISFCEALESDDNLKDIAIKIKAKFDNKN
ncbi:hypothetical protein FACS1894202_07540 [Clostridia bacterium]|nr:hypothetical protein FACS1894202_07540 [Clostridia bacterium]